MGDEQEDKFGPGTLWRWSVVLHRRGWRRLPRLLKLANYLAFRAILPPEAEMAGTPGLMHHGLGVVVHPTTVFGEGVLLSHGVTIAASVPDKFGVIHPVILEDRAFVGAGAVLLARGGPLRIGEGAVVGANAVVLSDVPPHARVFGIPAKPASV